MQTVQTIQETIPQIIQTNNTPLQLGSPQLNVTADRLIDIKELKGILGIKSNATIYEMARKSGLPKPKRIGPRCSRWVLSEIVSYINAQPRADIMGVA